MHLSSCRSDWTTSSCSLTDWSHCCSRTEIYTHTHTKHVMWCITVWVCVCVCVRSHTVSRAVCVSCRSRWQSVSAVRTLHSSLSSPTAWPSNTAFHWWLWETHTALKQKRHVDLLCVCVCVCVCVCASYYSVCGMDNSLRAVISLQLSPSLDTVRFLRREEQEEVYQIHFQTYLNFQEMRNLLTNQNIKEDRLWARDFQWQNLLYSTVWFFFNSRDVTVMVCV